MKFITWLFASTAHLVALQKIVQALLGLVTAVFVTIYLSPVEQGYFYTMGSLLSGYVLFDLGLSNLLIQVSSGKFTNLSWAKNRIIYADKSLFLRFFNFLSWAINWYFLIAIATLILAPIGYIYFEYANPSGNIAWKLPWVTIVFSVALSLPAIGFLAVMEGTGQIRSVYAIRIIYYIFGGFLSWILLVTGSGMFSQAALPLAMTVVVLCWVMVSFRHYLHEVDFKKSNFNWREEIWPQQKLVALNWLSNYLFQYIPITLFFYFCGAKLAGQMGLSMVIANILGAVAMSWVTAATPALTCLIAEGKYLEGKHLYLKNLYVGVGLLFLGILTTILLVIGIEPYSFSNRILPANQFIFVLLAFFSFHLSNALVIYFRAFKKELLALPSLITTLAIILGGFFIIPFYDPKVFLSLIFFATLTLLIYAISVFIRFDVNFKRNEY